MVGVQGFLHVLLFCLCFVLQNFNKSFYSWIVVVLFFLS